MAWFTFRAMVAKIGKMSPRLTADLSSSSPSQRPHVAAGAALHLRAPLLDPVFVELGGAASGVFTRARYAFNPGLVLVHEVAPAKGELGVLVGVTIP